MRRVSWYDGLIESPNVYGGDFNVVRFPTKRSSSRRRTGAMEDISNFIRKNMLVDLPTVGVDRFLLGHLIRTNPFNLE